MKMRRVSWCGLLLLLIMASRSAGGLLCDFSGNGSIDINDLLLLAEKWETNAPAFDVAPDGGDQTINLLDFAKLASNYPGFNFQVNPCNSIAGNYAPSPIPRFTATAQGDKIVFSDNIPDNCCVTFLWVTGTIQGNFIEITEHHFLYNPCYCNCNFPAIALLGPLTPGEYLVEAIDINGASLGVIPVVIPGA